MMGSRRKLPSGFHRATPHLRDQGGYKTGDRMTVVSGLVYRSNQLNPVSPDDPEKIADRGLKNCYDLRTEAERTAVMELLLNPQGEYGRGSRCLRWPEEKRSGAVPRTSIRSAVLLDG
jgi:hypothetical protein